MDEATWLSSSDPAAMLDYLRQPRWGEASLVTGGAFKGGTVQVGIPPIATDRKLRLFACACRMATGKWPDDPNLNEWAERGVEVLGVKRAMNGKTWTTYWIQSGVLPDDLMATLLRLIFNPFRPVELPTEPCPWCAGKGKWLDDIWPNLAKDQRYKTCVKCNGSGKRCPWLTPDVLAIAQTCYDLRDPAYFPLIWDALEEAGCTSEEIRHALAWEQRCPSCIRNPGKGYVISDMLTKADWEYSLCVPCNGTGWLPIPGEPFMVRGAWFIDLLLGKG